MGTGLRATPSLGRMCTTCWPSSGGHVPLAPAGPTIGRSGCGAVHAIVGRQAISGTGLGAVAGDTGAVVRLSWERDRRTTSVANIVAQLVRPEALQLVKDSRDIVSFRRRFSFSTVLPLLRIACHGVASQCARPTSSGPGSIPGWEAAPGPARWVERTFRVR
jgi:hypothetical protein